MSFLNELINSVTDEDLREQLHERMDIVIHKIKFMDKVPVACLAINNELHSPLDHLIELAGGEIVADPMLAKVLIYFEYQTGIAELMSKVISSLSPEWPAVAYNHVYLMDDAKVLAKEPQNYVEALEDIAEMLHPGFFVFGNEGENWVNFVQ
jgi:iron complex transport system substrate-binding protein